ncbi:lantibiotic dehydratase [Spirosoma areae]
MEGTDFYYLRTPLIGLPQLLTWLEQANLSACIQQSRVAEAIFLASPALSEQLRHDPALANPKVRQTALKYLLRMGSRSTPFGLFAGCSLGQLAPTSDLDLLERQVICHHWLDTAVLETLVNYLNQHPAIRPFLHYRPNTSLYPAGNQLRYVEASQDPSQPRFFTSQIPAQPALRRVLRQASSGATTNELSQYLTRQGYPGHEARSLIEQLIADQVLVSELAINVTGEDCLTRLADWLHRIPAAGRIGLAINRLRSLLAATDSTQVKHREIQTLFDQQFGLTLPDSPILQGDTLFSGHRNQLSATRLAELQRTLEKLMLSGALQSGSPALIRFKQQFYARYEEREIPLALALDADVGIGYGGQPLPGDGAFIHDLISSTRSTDPAEETAPENARTEKWINRLYTAWLDNPTLTLSLTDADLAAFGQPAHRLPASYYAFGYFLATSAQAIDAGDYRFRCKVIAGPSAFPLLGRFGRSDPKLAQKLRTAFQQLQLADPDRIHAEIVHLAQAPMGNVVQRPHLSEYEIPYLGHSSLPQKQQIPIDDLWISVLKGERIVLRSRRLGKEVVPRSTTAHNYQTGLPVYRFLCELQQQEGCAVHWHWGRLSTYRYLPRVQYRHVILQEARWRLDWTDYVPTLPDEENVTRWRHRWQWPRLIALVQADQELFLDLDNGPCQQLVVSTLRRLETIFLIEWLQTPDQCCVEGPDGKLTHEVVLPFGQPEQKSRSVLAPRVHDLVRRTFAPGSEWLYVKVYSGAQTASQVLTRLGKLARSLIRSRRVTHWFFIRYADPDPHLRIRFHLSPQASSTDVLAACQQQLQPLIDSGEVYRVQADTYERELERYGETRMVATEWLFWADSDAVLALCQQHPDERTRLAMALLGMDDYLTTLGFTLTDKEALCQQRFTALFAGHGATASTRKLLAKEYRQNQALLDELLNQPALPAHWQTYQAIFRKRNRRMAPFLKSALAPTERPPDYVASLLHVFLNRLFSQHPRTYELLVYHHLARAYQSQRALARKAC